MGETKLFSDDRLVKKMELLEHEYRRYKAKGWWLIPGAGLYLAHSLVSPILTPLYQKMLVTYGEFVTHVTLLLLTHHVAYILFGILTSLMCTWPSFNKYKINPGEWATKTDHDLIRRTAITLSMNFIVYFPAFIYFAKVYSLTGPSMDFEVPSMLENFMWVPVCQVADSFWLFVVHALLHTRWLYAKVHKKHHEYRVPIGVAAVYVHPVEYILLNIMGAAIGPMLLGRRMHFLSVAVWTFYRISYAVENHSGFDFPWSPHSVLPFAGNYASQFTIFDYFGGTSKAYFRKYKSEYSTFKHKIK